jgi:hypothetical protein
VKVRGYIRKDGTYVPPHYRTSPDGSKANNWSTKGNVNPFTGKPGHVDPYAPPSLSSDGRSPRLDASGHSGLEPPALIEGYEPFASDALQLTAPATAIPPHPAGLNYHTYTLLVQFDISALGFVSDKSVQAVAAPDDVPELISRTRHHLASWRFAPARRDGIPQPYTMVIMVTFRPDTSERP